MGDRLSATRPRHRRWIGGYAIAGATTALLAWVEHAVAPAGLQIAIECSVALVAFAAVGSRARALRAAPSPRPASRGEALAMPVRVVRSETAPPPVAGRKVRIVPLPVGGSSRRRQPSATLRG